jgi:hypothetical protein
MPNFAVAQLPGIEVAFAETNFLSSNPEVTAFQRPRRYRSPARHLEENQTPTPRGRKLPGASLIETEVRLQVTESMNAPLD